MQMQLPPPPPRLTFSRREITEMLFVSLAGAGEKEARQPSATYVDEKASAEDGDGSRARGAHVSTRFLFFPPPSLSPFLLPPGGILRSREKRHITGSGKGENFILPSARLIRKGEDPARR